jgi:hypothetical protein
MAEHLQEEGLEKRKWTYQREKAVLHQCIKIILIHSL